MLQSVDGEPSPMITIMSIKSFLQEKFNCFLFMQLGNFPSAFALIQTIACFWHNKVAWLLLSVAKLYSKMFSQLSFPNQKRTYHDENCEEAELFHFPSSLISLLFLNAIKSCSAVWLNILRTLINNCHFSSLFKRTAISV